MPHSVTSTASKSAPFASVADPETCGEDLPGNLKRVFSIADKHCGECNDYHVVKAALRVAGETLWEQGARPYMLRALQTYFSEFGDSDKEPLDVAIAACADTAGLSVCAHAALMAGEETFGRTRFTVVDKCRTPLELCEHYGEQHGLTIQTKVENLTEAADRCQADLVLVNNLLPFVPGTLHARLLRNLGSWLKKDGNILLWTNVHKDKVQTVNADQRHQKRKEQLRALLNSGQLSVEEPTDVFLARLDRNVDGKRYADANYSDTESLLGLVESAGLDLRSTLEIPPIGRSTSRALIFAGRGQA